MKIFLDSAKLDEIEHAYCCGVLDGVTTNPSLIHAAVDDLNKKGQKIDLDGYIRKILHTAKGTPVSLEVTATDYEGMVKQGRNLFKKFNPSAGNVYIKIPVNPSFAPDDGKEFDGIKAIKTLTGEGIPVNCTLVFTPEQALMAAKAGAKFISPFVGRIDDHIRNLNNIQFEKTDYFPSYGWKEGDKFLEDNGVISGIDLVKQIVEILNRYKIKSEVLAASIRSTRQMREAALVGADISTVPMKVIENLLKHHKTEEGMKQFAKDTIPAYADLADKE